MLSLIESEIEMAQNAMYLLYREYAHKSDT